MIGVYLLVTIWLHFSSLSHVSLGNILDGNAPLSLVPSPDSTTLSATPLNLYLEVSQLNGVITGSRVLVDGLEVGSVVSVSLQENQSNSADLDSVIPKTLMLHPKYLLQLEISGSHAQNLRFGTVGLITSPLVLSKNTAPISLIELLVPDKETHSLLEPGAHLKGYSSYSEFWSADLGRFNRGFQAAELRG